jgi:hypothetical protein
VESIAPARAAENRLVGVLADWQDSVFPWGTVVESLDLEPL